MIPVLNKCPLGAMKSLTRFFATASQIPIIVKTIREDGEEKYIDVDVDPSKPLLFSLISTTSIQHGCGGKGICGQCQIALPKDIYDRLPKPDQAELDTLATSLDPPK
ncbi:hypothetical protein JH06_0436 [Blastocystis sp. subtype 4]|uniref:hypothetical protein n=1 Tax=Blastocystis sp. subtype 4 TaxID=944170 RepID=UPI000711D8B4|nr:hypothetical protein JH06_0436 [Blastocystis sp. subtype 4]KNB46010.1 hypothetical protein JH06_0436 [Blastocystis sp. subtype 4]|eukprot:XP_014529453.1 hypothetical protein JH06_0436 [Blastocystis sp. subtype 4]